jgi:hypothetical protein
MGCFWVGDKMISVVRVGQIAIGDFSVDTFAPLGLGLLHRPDFLGSIAGVKFIKPIPQGGKLVIFPRRVHAVVDGDIAHFIFRENDFDK